MSSWKERVQEEMAKAEAERESSRLTSEGAAQQQEALRIAAIEARMPILEEIWGHWEDIDVDRLLNAVNSGVWDGFGTLETKEYKDKDGIVDEKHHVLAADEISIIESREETYGRRFGHYSSEHSAGGQDGGYLISESHFGLHKKPKGTKLIGTKERVERTSSLRVSLDVPVMDRMGKLKIKDTELGLVLGDGIVLPEGYEDASEKGKGIIVRFPIEGFDYIFPPEVLDAALLQSSVQRVKTFVPRMQGSRDVHVDYS